jgi:type III secretion protein C
VTAPPQYIAVINDISGKFLPSKISDTTIVKIIPLKYAWAYDMTFNYANGAISVPGISTLLQSIVSGESNGAASSPFNVKVGSENGGLKQVNMLGILDDTPQYAQDMRRDLKNMKNSSADQKDKSGQKSSENGSEAEAGEKNVSDISGATLPGFITCDQRLNAIIIRDRRENMPFYEEIIAKLDVPCEVIKIDVAIVNVTKTNGFNFGFDGGGVYANNGKFTTSHVTGEPGKANGSNSTASLLPDAVRSVIKLGTTGSIIGHLGIIKSTDIDFAINAMEASGNWRTVSKPSVLTLDNVAAILETEKVHYEAVNGANNSNAYSKTATTKLQVVPHIIPDDIDARGKRKMKLFVDIADGSFAADGTGDVVQHSLNTQSVLYEGQSLMIGGYDNEENDKRDSGVPILKDIPLIGVLFKRTTDSKSLSERIYVISPSVVEIRSDDFKYSKFVQPGQLAEQQMLDESEYEFDQVAPADEFPREGGRQRRPRARH